VKNLRASVDVIGWNDEDDARRLSNGPDSPYSPSALPSADRFANSSHFACCFGAAMQNLSDGLKLLFFL